MKRASDFRAIARANLQGKWKIAVIAGLIAALLGAVSLGTPSFDFKFSTDSYLPEDYTNTSSLFSIPVEIPAEVLTAISGFFVVFLIIVLVLAAVSIFLGSVVGLGYAKFNLDLTDRKTESQLGTLFDYFSHWKTAVCASLLQLLYVFLWMLLLIVPGIMAAYSYIMTPYILAENPCMTARQALARSKALMRGNRWRLFCLQLSFIGWSLLAALTMGIGNLWLTPYRQAATAAFYRDISDRAKGPEYPAY